MGTRSAFAGVSTETRTPLTMQVTTKELFLVDKNEEMHGGCNPSKVNPAYGGSNYRCYM